MSSHFRQHGFLMLNGRCVAECPAERYYRGKSGRHEACIPCYYTCRTCSGSNDYEVSLDMRHNFPKTMRNLMIIL